MAEMPPVSVVETPEFINAAERLFSDDERKLLIDYLAQNPTTGDLIPGGGGVRKLRWRVAGRGKRGGARVVYYYHSEAVPLFALTAYVKNERADLSKRQLDSYRELAKAIAEAFARRKREKRS